MRGRVRAHDPFELIRWLALSQPDPRKALAELVQNSLDAGARRIRITRVRERGVLCLKILDDGAGVIPEMDRPEALRYIATHIGHSRKRDLSPQERMRLMTQGQYGIGLLGFWSLGEALEMRSSVAGQKACRLQLHRDRPDFLIEPLRGRLPLDETWTEVVVLHLHREAMPVLVGRRAADYLASELRGQLLAREVELLIEDRVSRGPSQKLIAVRPLRFLGERIEVLHSAPVEGYSPIRLEIYVAGENPDASDGSRLAVYSSGTLVAESFRDLSGIGLDRFPWTDPRLTGMVDFPDFRVPPGSRRGIVLDEAADAFARSLLTIEPVLTRTLEEMARERDERVDRGLIRDLQRAFRDFYRQQPRYAMLPVRSSEDQPAGPENGPKGLESPPAGDGGAEASDGGGRSMEEGEEPQAAAAEGFQPDIAVDETLEMFPPGPLSEVHILPSQVRVLCGGSRSVRAEALDASGRVIPREMIFDWSLDPELGTLEASDPGAIRVRIRAAEQPGDGYLTVRAREGDREADATVTVEVLEEMGSGRSGEGIPEPEFVNQAGAPWRSRMLENRWQINSGHKDYRSVADRPALKLRYLAMLFAKEIVLRSHQDPRLEKPLEQMAEVLCYADQRFAARGRPRKNSAEAE